MQLHLNATSPFARAARIVALEKGLQNQLELCWSDPWADPAELLQANPVGRIPVLITSTGTAIAESLLIAQYLDAQSATPALLPAASLAQVLEQTGRGYGLMEAAFSTVIHRKYEGADADLTVLGQRRKQAIERTLTALETASAAVSGDESQPAMHLGHIVVAVALDYVSFRLPETAWQAACPALSAWHQRFTQRSSFTETAFA